MRKLFRNVYFWQKFSRFLLLLISACLIFAAFNQANLGVKADFTCPQQTGAVSITQPSNNQTLPFGTTSTTISWTAAPYALSYVVSVTNNTNGSTIYSQEITANSFLLSSLVNGNSYTVLVIPKNNCGQGPGSQVSFSIATTSGTTTCSGPPMWCGPAEDRDLVSPDPNNNCQYPCSTTLYPYNPGGSTTPTTCSTDTFTCPNGSIVGRNPNNNCNFFSCTNLGNQCRSITCSAPPAGCSVTGRITSSCDPNVALSCGVITGTNCASSTSFTQIGGSGTGITITNQNSSSSSSSSSNTNNNNITVR